MLLRLYARQLAGKGIDLRVRSGALRALRGHGLCEGACRRRALRGGGGECRALRRHLVAHSLNGAHRVHPRAESARRGRRPSDVCDDELRVGTYRVKLREHDCVCFCSTLRVNLACERGGGR